MDGSRPLFCARLETRKCPIAEMGRPHRVYPAGQQLHSSSQYIQLRWNSREPLSSSIPPEQIETTGQGWGWAKSTLHATAEDGSQPPRSPNKVPRATFPPVWVSHTAFLGAGTRRQIADIQRSVRAGDQCSAVQCSTRDLNAPGNSK